MVQSMTGFGSAEKNGYRVEIRSINHRFLEIFMRVPPYMNQLDIPLRNSLKENFSRGKIDVTITVKESATAELNINTELVRKIITAFRGLQQELSIKGDIDVNTLVGLHEMFIETGEKLDSETITALFSEAIGDLHEMRSKEGENLASAILKMAESVKQMNAEIRDISGRLAGRALEKFRLRLALLLEGKEPDENRLLQEAAIIAARMDISEEIARIESHLEQFGEILSKGGIIGRKLDFILQELNREVNTIASKSAEYDLSNITVGMKTELERIREQVQNIE
jgi:uncharacterized protein (TIGR00255 family)